MLHPEHADDDENALMIARIGHERAEREALEQQRLELVGRKQKLIAENKKRKDDLANLDKDLEKFIDVCLPFTGTYLLLLTIETGCETYPGTFRKGCLNTTAEPHWAVLPLFIANAMLPRLHMPADRKSALRSVV